MNKMLLKRLQRGFTLIELMIAIAVIVILVVVAIPQFVSYTHKGEDDAALADARTFLAAAVSASAETLAKDEKGDKKDDKPKTEDKPKAEGGK